MPVFLPNIPQSTDQLSISQGNILTNFTVLGAIAGNSNAASSSINTNAGFNWVYLSPQSSTPPAGAGIPAGSVAIYSAMNTNSGINELYVNKGNALQVPITSFKANSTGDTSGWTYIPSGLLIAWGTGTIPTGGLLTVTYASVLTNFPGFSTLWTAPQLTRLRVSTAAATTNFVLVQAYNQTSFSAQSSTVPVSGGGTVSFSWMVIGM